MCALCGRYVQSAWPICGGGRVGLRTPCPGYRNCWGVRNMQRIARGECPKQGGRWEDEAAAPAAPQAPAPAAPAPAAPAAAAAPHIIDVNDSEASAFGSSSSSDSFQQDDSDSDS
eukprot:2745321-Pyramimonas_sp.AAC.1